ncbi:MAG: extensin family protein [Pseudomonadota bacterium]
MRPLVTLIVIAALAYAGYRALEYAEAEYPQHLPWTPLSIDHPVGAATQMKIAALAGDKPACLALFAASDLDVAPRPDVPPDPNCGQVDSVALQRMTASYDPGTVRLACPLAAALAIWERQVVQPAAARTLGSDVAAIRHFGTYSCRRIAGSSRWSTHATARAIDIAGMRLTDGRTIDLARDWDDGGDAGAFLEEIRTGGCDVFGTLLGPDYNAAHRDHFHLQATGFGTCR